MPVGLCADRALVIGQHLARNPFDVTALLDDMADLMAKARVDPSRRNMGMHALGKRGDHARPGAPCDMEPRHGVAMPFGAPIAALGPAHHRKPAQAQIMQPRAHIACGKLEIGLGPLTRDLILGTVELRAARPVALRKIQTVADAHAALLGGVHHKEAAKAPMGLPADEMSRLLFQQDHPLAAIRQLIGRNQTCQTGPDHDDIGVVVALCGGHGAPPSVACLSSRA